MSALDAHEVFQPKFEVVETVEYFCGNLWMYSPAKYVLGLPLRLGRVDTQVEPI